MKTAKEHHRQGRIGEEFALPHNHHKSISMGHTMITPDQLDELRGIFEGYDDDVLLSKISVTPTVNRGIVISIDQIGWPEFAAIFPSVEPWALKGDPA